MGLTVEEELRCPQSGYSIDMLVQLDERPGSGCNTPATRREWAVEFDGPHHFLECGLPTGATLIKRHHLSKLGYTLVSVPYWEWNQVSNTADRQTYLKRRLQIV